jgi:leucyl aminopeptidase (aminopeptidase T)
MGLAPLVSQHHHEMKKTLSLFIFLSTTTLFAQQVNDDSLARKIVERNVMVKAGETVYIYSDQNGVSLMEALSKACAARGATAYPKLNPDKFQGTESMNTFLERELSPADKFVHWLNTTDVCIILTPFDKDPKWLFKDLVDTQNAAVDQQAVREALVKTHARILYINIPTRAFAEGLSLNYNAYEEMSWYAIDAVYDSALATRVNRLKSLLAQAKQIRLTSPLGTNFTFSTTGRPVLSYDGQVSAEEAAGRALYKKIDKLPAGMLEVSIVENSANGKVIVSQTECDYEAVNQATLTFVGGKLQPLTARSGGECLQNKFASLQGPQDVVGSISFGFNPLLKSMDTGGGLYWPKAAAGMVTLTLGSNQFAGGNNAIDTPQLSFPLNNVTVEVDGKVAFRTP